MQRDYYYEPKNYAKHVSPISGSNTKGGKERIDEIGMTHFSNALAFSFVDSWIIYMD
jgi:hypothetical protein